MQLLLCLGPLVLAMVLYGLHFMLALRSMKPLRHLLKTPKTPLDRLPETGQVHVTGELRGTELISPLSHHACIFWSLETQVPRLRLDGSWQTVARRVSSAPVVLHDGTNEVLLDLQEVQPVILQSFMRTRHALVWQSARRKAEWAALDMPIPKLFGQPNAVRVVEHVLRNQSKVQVYGTITRWPNHMVLGSALDAPLFLSDGTEAQVRAYRNTLVSNYLGAPIGLIIVAVVVGLILIFS